MTIILQPVSMVVPNSDCIYAPSRLKDSITITPLERRRVESANKVEMLVSLEADGKSNPQKVAAYGFGWGCWYIIRERDSLLDRAFRLTEQIKRLPRAVLPPLLNNKD